MTVKEKIIEEISSKFKDGMSFSTANVKSIISSVTLDAIKVVQPPSKLKKGDVFTSMVGTKVRPCVVIKIVKDTVIYVPLTTADCINSLSPYTSRFLRDGWFTNTISTCEIEYATKNFICVFDNQKDLRVAINALKEYYKGIIW